MFNLKKIGLVCSASLLISVAFANDCSSQEAETSTVQTQQAAAPQQADTSGSYVAGQKLGDNINKATGATVNAWNKTSTATVGFWNSTTGSVTNWWSGVTTTVKDPTED